MAGLFLKCRFSFRAGCAISVLRMNLVQHPGLETLDFKDPKFCTINLFDFQEYGLPGSFVNQKTELLKNKI